MGPNTVASGGGGGGGDTLMLSLCGTRDGVTEARRRLELTIRTTEVIVEAPPSLAAALRASKRALLISLEKELRVNIFVGSPILVAYRGANGGGGDGSGGGGDDAGLGHSSIEAGGDRGGGGTGRDPRGERGEGGAGTTLVEAVEVTLRGVPEDIKAARFNLAQLERDCVEVVVPVERRSLNAIYGPGGANLQQMEVCKEEERAPETHSRFLRCFDEGEIQSSIFFFRGRVGCREG